jgi:quinol monooxygenase YgiN
MSYVVIVHLRAKPGMEQKMVDILSTNMIATHKEPGLRKFALHRDHADPRHFMVVEVYDSRADYDYHHAQAHYAVCMSQLPATLEGSHQSTHVEPLKIGDPAKGLL